MAKFSDAVRNTLIGYFNIGDQPTEAQFTALILAIQEGIEEHDHDGTGDGDGIASLQALTGVKLIGANPTLHIDAGTNVSLLLDKGAAADAAATNFRTAGVDKFIMGTGVYSADDTNWDIGTAGVSIIRITSGSFVGIGNVLTPVCAFDLRTGNISFSIGEVTLADEASVALETVIGGGTLGIIEVVDISTAQVAGSVFVRGGINAVVEIDDPMTKISQTDDDGFLCFLADGDATYSMKNRLGAEKIFVLRYMGG